MNDTAGSSLPQQAGDTPRHTLIIAQIAAQLAAAGVPRSDRRIKHYCQTGYLDALKHPSPTGDQWYVDPASVPKLIGDLQQWDAQRAAREASLLQPAASHPVTPVTPSNSDADAAGSSLLQPAATELENKDINGLAKPDGGVMQLAATDPSTPHSRPSTDYVQQLETRIAEKDDVIGMLRGELAQRNDEIVRRNERERETNILIRGLQNLVLQLQPGRARADVRHDAPINQSNDLARDAHYE